MPTSTQNVRVALFLPFLDYGGAECVMLQLAASFSGRGIAVDLVLGISGGPLEPYIAPSVRVVALNAPRTIGVLRPLVGYLRRAKPAAFLSTLEHGNVLAVWACGLARTRTRLVLREANVLIPDEYMRGPKSHILRMLMRYFYPFAGAIVAVSTSVAKNLQQQLALPPDQIHTIYNPILTPDLTEKAAVPMDDPWFAGGAPPVVLGAGRLTPQKDFATLIRAFARVRARRPVRLVILGEGEQRAALETLARDLRVDADVRLPGFDDNPFRYMSRASVFALTSVFEGLPGSLIQAMACGCRVVSTDCPGGSREIMDGTQPIVPMRNPEALANAISMLLDDASHYPERRQYSSLNRFAEQSVVDAYLDVLGVSG